MSTFLDQVTIDVKAGNGGDGMVAFLREKYVPNGGPAGGDGGKGGSIILKVDEGLRTLMDFRYRRHFRAKPGENGMIKGMHGRGAKDDYIAVPPGTIVKDADTGEVLGDLTEKGQELLVAKGGRGGRGNIRFATSKNPAPEIAENGEPGQERTLILELSVLADVGLVGFPSVGKSTLLSVISAAKPKIGSYPFTTLVPKLGMVTITDGRSFVVADLPGLIEGASKGIGLGIQFLRHIERTRVLLHLIDMSGEEGRDPYEDYLAINHELSAYDLRLLERPQIIVATKMDLPEAAENLKQFEAKLKEAEENEESPFPLIFPISAATHAGLDPLLQATADLLDKTPAFPLVEVPTETEAHFTFAPQEKEFTVTRDPDRTWVIGGEKIERLFKMTNLDHEESLMRFSRQLRGMGVDDELRKLGAKDGDLVRIDDFVFEFLD